MTTTPIEVGDIVLYRHPEDGVVWPAMVLEVVQETGPDGAVTDPPDGSDVTCLLQIFRARGNDWKRAVEAKHAPEGAAQRGTWYRK